MAGRRRWWWETIYFEICSRAANYPSFKAHNYNPSARRSPHMFSYSLHGPLIRCWNIIFPLKPPLSHIQRTHSTQRSTRSRSLPLKWNWNENDSWKNEIIFWCCWAAAHTISTPDCCYFIPTGGASAAAANVIFIWNEMRFFFTEEICKLNPIWNGVEKHRSEKRLKTGCWCDASAQTRPQW